MNYVLYNLEGLINLFIMENTEIKLKPKRKNLIDKVKALFEDKNKRILYVALFILPFFIGICIFSFVAFKEAKGLISLATGNDNTNNGFSIPTMSYSLRESATDVQKQYFEELKEAVEKTSNSEILAGLVGKNFVADFYTWTNKQGQYDVGGLCYVCSKEYENENYKENIYLKARDGFYKYINEYINKYGKSNVLEVAEVNVVSSKKTDYEYILHEFIEAHQLEDESWVKNYDDVAHECYDVKLTWTYKQETKMDLNSFANSINLLIIENDGRYEIVEASENTIDVRQIEEEIETDFESE